MLGGFSKLPRAQSLLNTGRFFIRLVSLLWGEIKILPPRGLLVRLTVLQVVLVLLYLLLQKILPFLLVLLYFLLCLLIRILPFNLLWTFRLYYWLLLFCLLCWFLRLVGFFCFRFNGWWRFWCCFFELAEPLDLHILDLSLFFAWFNVLRFRWLWLRILLFSF